MPLALRAAVPTTPRIQTFRCRAICMDPPGKIHAGSNSASARRWGSSPLTSPPHQHPQRAASSIKPRARRPGRYAGSWMRDRPGSPMESRSQGRHKSPEKQRTGRRSGRRRSLGEVRGERHRELVGLAGIASVKPSLGCRLAYGLRQQVLAKEVRARRLFEALKTALEVP